jgi:predicted DNA-binding transcriptional regulator YafY
VDSKASSDDDIRQPHEKIDVIEDDASEPFDDEAGQDHDHKYTSTARRFHLLYLLSLNTCSRSVIFERLKDYYNVSEDEASRVCALSQRVGQMLKRDIEYLEEMGFTIEQTGRGNAATYHVKQGSGPSSPFLFNQTELDVLVLLHTLFADPAKYAQLDPTLPLPAQPPRNPFAEDILALIERLATTLTPQQQKEFERWTRKPYVYLNLDTITDYLPHRATIDKIIQAIALGQQISFEYAALHRRQETKLHEQVDPYYITREDGHFYLIGFSHDPYNRWMNRFFEFRIDRIQGESLKPNRKPINMERRRKPIEFCYWIDESLANRGLSNRWLAQEVGPDREVFTENGKEVKRVLVRAQAYSEFRIRQQLHKYGDKVELVEPPELREMMRSEIERLYHRYNNNK